MPFCHFPELCVGQFDYDAYQHVPKHPDRPDEATAGQMTALAGAFVVVNFHRVSTGVFADTPAPVPDARPMELWVRRGRSAATRQ